MILRFKVRPVPEGIEVATERNWDKEMLFKGVTVSSMVTGMQNYKSGSLIQDAFDFLNPDQREFLMTGMTPEEWEEMFGEETGSVRRLEIEDDLAQLCREKLYDDSDK